MWSEEEMRDIPDEVPEPVSEPSRQPLRSRAGGLRWALAQTNAARASSLEHETTRSSVVYGPGTAGSHGNFIAASYRRITAHPEWSQRLDKVHTGKRKARPQGREELTREWRELDTATSSDALLMNIFCYPRVLAGRRLPALLGVAPGTVPEFGYRPRLRCTGTLPDRTEMDLRLGSLLVEAKLTESDFQRAPLRLIERYEGFAEVFDVELLGRSGEQVESYQLLRGVLGAWQQEVRFAVFLDARRPDLLESWFAVMRAVRSYELQARLRLVTWQEIAGELPRALQLFLAEKYGIVSRG